MLVRQLMSVEVTGTDAEFSVMAELWMEGDELRADYRDRGARETMEGDGAALPCPRGHAHEVPKQITGVDRRLRRR